MNVSLKTLLEEMDLEPRSYSGRFMYGDRCVGIALEDNSELWNIAIQLGMEGYDIQPPRTDSLGLGIIAYWPSEKWEDDD